MFKKHKPTASNVFFFYYSLCTRCMIWVFVMNGCTNSRHGNETTIWADIEGSMTVWDKDWLKVCLYTNGHLNESSRLSHWILPPINLKAKLCNNLINAPSISLSPHSYGTHVRILTFGWYRCYSCGEEEQGLSGGFQSAYGFCSTEDNCCSAHPS